MTNVELDSLVSSYLNKLNDALGDLPAPQRQQIVESIANHIDEARSSASSEDEVTLREILDHVGDPSEIAIAAQEEVGFTHSRRSRRVRRSLICSVVTLVTAGAVVLSLFLAGVFTTPPVRYGVVPRIVSLPLTVAEAELKSAGFKPWLECTRPSIRPKLVTMQSPISRHKLPLGDYVVIAAQSSPPGCHTNWPPNNLF